MSSIKSILLALVVTFIGCQSSVDSELRDEKSTRGNRIQQIVSEISKANKIECGAVGVRGRASGLYSSFKQLSKYASTEELITFLGHPKIPVVVYSSYSLIDREKVDPFYLYKKFTNKNDTIEFWCGCEFGHELVSTLIYKRYWDQRLDQITRTEEYINSEYNNYHVFDSPYLQSMDSLIFMTESPASSIFKLAWENRISDDNFKEKILNSITNAEKKTTLISEFRKEKGRINVIMHPSIEYYAYSKEYRKLMREIYWNSEY